MSEKTDLEKIKDVCVLVKTLQGKGTGYLVSQDLIVTCEHVVGNVADGDPVTVSFEHGEYTANVFSRDEKNDCAILKLENPLSENLEPLVISQKDCNKRDSWEAYGFPGITEEVGVLLTGNVQDPKGKDIQKIESMVLFSPQIAAGQGTPAHGFSGSPVLIKGLVVGHLKRIIENDDNRAEMGMLYATPRKKVSELLINSGFSIREEAQPVIDEEYIRDITQLKNHSSDTLTIKSSLSEIVRSNKNGEEKRIKIDRESTQKLWESVQTGSIIVTGEPGSGKSGSLLDLYEIINSQGYDVVFLSADRFLHADNVKNLRESIGEGLSHNVPDILKHWLGDNKAFLIIDALDKALSFAAEKTLRDMITLILKSSSRWVVVTAIRKYDLDRNRELQEIFKGSPPSEFFDKNLTQIRHFEIPLLSNKEIEEIKKQSSEVSSLMHKAGQKLINLTKNLFNLRLLTELIDKIPVEKLLDIQTQIGLLNKYWETRVSEEGDESYSRQKLAINIVDKMIENKSLTVNSMDIITDTSTSKHLRSLLSSNVLVSPDLKQTKGLKENTITFSHNILFDYAVAVKLQEKNSIKVICETFEADQDLIFIINPSIYMYFQSIWLLDEARSRFWNNVFNVIDSKVRVIVKIIGPCVATKLIQQISDCEVLMAKLEEKHNEKLNIGEIVLNYMIKHILNNSADALYNNLQVWCEILERCSSYQKLSLATICMPLLLSICRNYKSCLTPSQKNLLGIASRRFFKISWEEINGCSFNG